MSEPSRATILRQALDEAPAQRIDGENVNAETRGCRTQ